MALFHSLIKSRQLSLREVPILRVLAAAALSLVACEDGRTPTTPSTREPRMPAAVATTSTSEVLVGAGDIGNCNSLSRDDATAALLDNIPGTIFTAGDNAYPDGTARDFTNCYGPTWGRHLARTYPAPGNHDYHTADAAGYFSYFGDRAGPSGRGYYSYDLGSWHIISLNSEIPLGSTDPQAIWLRADLSAHANVCTLAYWHRPLFSSGNHGNFVAIRPLFQILYEAGADVVISGHSHHYERFAPQTPSGALDLQYGIREFVVGTGGSGLQQYGTPIANSEAHYTAGHGVLKLTLDQGSYSWTFIPVAGASPDEGTGTCHTAALGAAREIISNRGNQQTAPVNTAVTIPPSVKVLDASGNPVAGTGVTFAVGSGGGRITSGPPTTDANGVVAVGSWTLGSSAGPNTLTATSSGLAGSPVTFTATATADGSGGADASRSTATVPSGVVGSSTTIVVQARDADGNPTTGGDAMIVRITGANSATAPVIDHNNGTYTAAYTPTTAGTDQVAITLNAAAISGSPYTSTVAARTAATIALDAGNNQSATVNTLVTAPSVKVTGAGGSPVAGVAVTFKVAAGGGRITGDLATTNVSGIATVGSWTLGTKAGVNKLTATASGLTGSPVTFRATGTAGVATRILIRKGDNQTAPAGTAVLTPPTVKLADAYGNGVSGVSVTFAAQSGGGSVTGATQKTAAGGTARVGSWKLGPRPGSNTLTATAALSGIAGNPVTFRATGN